MLLKEWQGLRPEIEPRLDPEPIHLRCRRRPNAVELLDRQRLDERGPYLRCNYKEAIGLAMIRGELGEEFVVGNTRGGEYAAVRILRLRARVPTAAGQIGPGTQVEPRREIRASRFA